MNSWVHIFWNLVADSPESIKKNQIQKIRLSKSEIGIFVSKLKLKYAFDVKFTALRKLNFK